MEQSEEHEQVARARAGDRRAFARLVEAYWGRIYRFVYGLTHHVQRAEDLTQDTFLKAWAGLAGFQATVSFRAWLFQIARHGAIDSRRGPRGQPAQPLPERLAQGGPGPVTRVVLQEGATLLEQACARLPVGYRAALLLWTQEGLSYPEIARVLGVSEETARWRVYRARQFLLKEMGPYWNKKSTGEPGA